MIVHFIELIERCACHVAPLDLAALVPRTGARLEATPPPSRPAACTSSLEAGTGSGTCRRGPCGPAPTKFSPHRAVERGCLFLSAPVRPLGGGPFSRTM